MQQLLLSSRALVTDALKQAFIALCDQTDDQSDQIVIIVNAVDDGKRHPQVLKLQQAIQNMGFQNVTLFNVDVDDFQTLVTAKAIVISGGYEFKLVDHLKRSGMLLQLRTLINQGKPVYGISAGAIVLGPDLDLFATLYPEDNFLPDKHVPAIQATNVYICPHYDRQCAADATLANQISDWEHQQHVQVTRLNDKQGLAIHGDLVRLIL